MVHFISKLLAYCTILLHPPPPIQGMSGDFVLANMTNPHLSRRGGGGGRRVVGHNIDRRISIELTKQNI